MKMPPSMLDELAKIASCQKHTVLFTALDKLANTIKGYPATSSVGAANVPGMSIHCLKCGAKIDKGTKNCPTCGNDVRKVAVNQGGGEKRAHSDPSFSGATGSQGSPAGKAIRCRKCGMTAEKGVKRCPQCNTNLKGQAETNGGRTRNVDDGDTGASAAEAEAIQDESLESGTAVTMGGEGKTAAAAGLRAATQMLPPEVAGALALGGGGYGGVKMHQFMKKVDETPEQRRRRLMIEHQRRSMRKQGSANKGRVLNIRKGFKLSTHQVDGLSTPTKSFKRLSAKARRSRTYVAR